MIILEIKGLEEFNKMAKKAPMTVMKEINTAIRKTFIIIQGKAIEESPTDTGGLRSHWGLQTRGLTGRLWNKKKYALAVHEGAKPHWTKASNLQGWADRHGIPVGAVQQSIAKKGTKANPFLDRAIKGTSTRVNMVWNKSLENLIKKL